MLLHEFFLRAASRWPARPALEVPPGPRRSARTVATYAEVAQRSLALARLLRGHAAPDRVIAILLPRNSADLCIAQLAVLRSGAAYACIDPVFPDQQARDILRDSEASILLTDDAGEERHGRGGLGEVPLLNVRRAAASPAAPIPAPSPGREPAAGDLAYLIYTSGTTGRPKGVMIEHGKIGRAHV